jgi:hypothetical protein
MRKRLSSVRLLISLCALLGPVPLQASSPDKWHHAAGGRGVEYRWSAGFWGACHIEFRDSAIAGTSASTEIAGDISYDHPSLNGIEHDALQSFNLRIYGYGSAIGPDVACQPINDVIIHELKRSR